MPSLLPSPRPLPERSVGAATTATPHRTTEAASRLFSGLAEALAAAISGRPRPLWRRAEPMGSYDALIVGGGGHGLATAWHLVRDHGLARVAVLEAGRIGGGNTGRNTTILRSNYLWAPSAALYDRALTLWPGLSRALDINLMVSQRGVITLAHGDADRRQVWRGLHANRVCGIDAEWLEPAALKALCPPLDLGPQARFPIVGAGFQPRGGIARHDAVAWGYAAAADRLGVDLVEDCPVLALLREGNRVVGVQTTRGPIRAGRVGLAAAAGALALVETVGLRLPLRPYPLQAMVSEPVKPVLHQVVMSASLPVHFSQSDKGELVFGAGLDPAPGLARRGPFATLQAEAGPLVSLFPMLSRLRLMRTWAGVVDVSPDASPILGPMPLDGLFLNGGWGTGGFKATPAVGEVFAATLAEGRAPPLAEAFGLERFATGALIDEHGAAGVSH